MATITVTYQLPDDSCAFTEAHNCRIAWAALSAIDEHCRNHLKHGDPADAAKAIEYIRGIALEAIGVIIQ